MTVTSLVHSNIIRSHHSTRRIENRQSKKTKKFLIYVLIFAIFVCGLSYLFVANSIVAKGYEIQKLIKQTNELNSLNKNLQVEVSNLKSINFLGAKTNDLEMIKAQKIDYVSLPGSSALLVQ